MTTTTKIKQTCLKCGAEGKYLGVFRDCSGRIEIKCQIWRCEACGRVWQTKERGQAHDY